MGHVFVLIDSANPEPLGRSAQNSVVHYTLIPTDTCQIVTGIGWVRAQERGDEKYYEVVLVRRRIGIRPLKK